MKRVFLLTGSNLNESIMLLEKASVSIKSEIGNVVKKSNIYSSESWGYKSKRLYYNQCIEINTESEPGELLKRILKIEEKMGRFRSGIGYEDREIDIDILFYGGEIINSENLTIPHPRIHLRRFALVPMNEIAGDFVHPVFRKTIHVLLSVCPDQSKVERI